MYWCALTISTPNSRVGLHFHSAEFQRRGGGGGVEDKIRIFCNVRFVWRHQQDRSLWANNNMGRRCAILVISRSHQGHFIVKLKNFGMGNTTMFALITPPSTRLKWTSKITITQQRVASASIAKYWYIIGYGGWNGLSLFFTALIPPKRNVKAISKRPLNFKQPKQSFPTLILQTQIQKNHSATPPPPPPRYLGTRPKRVKPN